MMSLDQNPRSDGSRRQPRLRPMTRPRPSPNRKQPHDDRHDAHRRHPQGHVDRAGQVRRGPRHARPRPGRAHRGRSRFVCRSHGATPTHRHHPNHVWRHALVRPAELRVGSLLGRQRVWPAWQRHHQGRIRPTGSGRDHQRGGHRQRLHQPEHVCRAGHRWRPLLGSEPSRSTRQRHHHRLHHSGGRLQHHRRHQHRCRPGPYLRRPQQRGGTLLGVEQPRTVGQRHHHRHAGARHRHRPHRSGGRFRRWRPHLRGPHRPIGPLLGQQRLGCARQRILCDRLQSSRHGVGNLNRNGHLQRLRAHLCHPHLRWGPMLGPEHRRTTRRRHHHRLDDTGGRLQYHQRHQRQRRLPTFVRQTRGRWCKLLGLQLRRAARRRDHHRFDNTCNRQQPWQRHQDGRRSEPVVRAAQHRAGPMLGVQRLGPTRQRHHRSLPAADGGGWRLRSRPGSRLHRRFHGCELLQRSGLAGEGRDHWRHRSR